MAGKTILHFKILEKIGLCEMRSLHITSNVDREITNYLCLLIISSFTIFQKIEGMLSNAEHIKIVSN
jgi:hypothetical protein